MTECDLLDDEAAIEGLVESYYDASEISALPGNLGGAYSTFHPYIDELVEGIGNSVLPDVAGGAGGSSGSRGGGVSSSSNGSSRGTSSSNSGSGSSRGTTSNRQGTSTSSGRGANNTTDSTSTSRIRNPSSALIRSLVGEEE